MNKFKDMRRRGNALVVLLVSTAVAGAMVYVAMRGAAESAAPPVLEKKNPILDKVRASAARPPDEAEVTGRE